MISSVLIDTCPAPRRRRSTARAPRLGRRVPLAFDDADAIALHHELDVGLGQEASLLSNVQVVAALSATVPVSDDLRQARRERQRRELALAYATGKLSEASFLSAVAALNAEGDPLPPLSSKWRRRTLHQPD